MARQLRLEYPGSLWHVTSRGNEQRDTFRDDSDRLLFLDLLGEAVERFDWILPAYVLMSNHFHLLFQLTVETLSKGMQWLNGQYARRFNRRHKRVGHLFQDRPWCVLIDDQTYSLEVLRYVVLNPVRACMVRMPEDYRWSSHRAVLGDVEAPKWLAVDDVLVNFGGSRERAREEYRIFVNAGIGSKQNPFDKIVGQMYLGSEEWVEDVREKIELKPRSDNHPRLQREPVPVAMADVVTSVARACSTNPDVIRQGHGGVPRMIAAWVACYEGFLTNRTIAAGLRLRSGTSVTKLVRKCDEVLSADQSVRDVVDRAVSTLRRKKCQV